MRPAVHPSSGVVFPEEFERARGNPPRLFAQAAGRLAADGQAHPFHPVAHRPAEFDFATTGADGLCLEVQKDHPGAGAVRDAIGHHLAAGLHPARLDPERDPVPLLLPGLFVGKPLVWQASQAEPGIADPDALTFIGHHFRGDVYQGALPLRYHLPSTFPAVDEHQLMQSKVCVAA